MEELCASYPHNLTSYRLTHCGIFFGVLPCAHTKRRADGYEYFGDKRESEG